MDPIPALPDDPVEFLDARLGAVFQFARRPRPKSQRENREDDRFEDGSELDVEWTVDEDVVE